MTIGTRWVAAGRGRRWGLVGVLVAILAPLAGAARQIPTFAEVSGHAFGDRITVHHQMVAYLERLAAASPRVSLIDQGTSWEGRRLLAAVVTSPANHGRLNQIQTNSRRLGDPRATSPGDADAIVSSQPAVIWFGGSIHGFELSGSEGALKLLEHLTTRDDPATLAVLDSVVVIIDPMLNPDGRDAFAHLNHENLGRRPTPRPEDWTNSFTGWQAVKFRTGHYYFDTNRDWFAQTQPETRNRMGTIRAWRPQAITDMHEMGPDVEFFFYPGAAPTSPHVPAFSLRWIAEFADAYAAAFDAAGYDYVTREMYDYFYPGYTDGYGSLLGAAGMLYEQGSSRGLALMRSDRTVRPLAQAIEQQYTAAWTAARVAATRRDRFLREFYQGNRDALAPGADGIRRYVIAPRGDPDHVTELVNVLIRGGVEVARLTDTLRLNGVRDRTGATVGRRAYGPGSYVVDLAQPRSPLIRALLQPETPLPADFVAEARERVDRGQDAEIYDITAWSLPLLFNIDVTSSNDAAPASGERLGQEIDPPSRAIGGRAGYAYLIDGRQTAAVAALYRLLADGYRAGMAVRPTRIEGNDFPSGTVVVRVGQNDETIHDAVRAVASHFHLTVTSVGTGLAPQGFPPLGSEDVVSVRRPEVAIVAEDPIQGYSFGWAWYVLDQVAEIPTTVLRAGSVANTPLAPFDVIVVPNTSARALRERWGEAGIERVGRWVRDGGTLVAIGGATDLAREALDLIALRSWYDEEEAEDAQHFTVPGTILRANLDPAYWLSAGYVDAELPVLAEGDRIYLAPTGPPSAQRRVVARYAPSDRLRMSGHAWPESIERLGEAVFVYEQRVERGRVIAFAEDPNYRGFWRGPRRLFLNAVVVGPSAP